MNEMDRDQINFKLTSIYGFDIDTIFMMTRYFYHKGYRSEEDVKKYIKQKIVQKV
jgi:hypothetical protein